MDIVLVGKEHIEQEIWEIIKGSSKNDSAKKIIASNASLVDYKNSIYNLSEGLGSFTQALEPYRTFMNQAKGLHEVAKVIRPLSEIAEQSNGISVWNKLLFCLT